MKFGKVGQVGLVTAIALLMATLFTACGTLTVGFMFVATNKNTPGQIEVYEVNSESGAARTIPTSPFPSGGRDPIAEAVTADSLNLYVVNEDDNNITQFGIGTDGKLYPQSTINTPGSFPLALAVDSTLSSSQPYLYVVDTLEPAAGCTLTNPCPGAIAGYAITTAATAAANSASFGAGSLGQFCGVIPPATTTTCSIGNPVVDSNGGGYLPLQLNAAGTGDVLTPTAIEVLANGQYIYVTAYDANVTPNVGYLFGFVAGSGGALTPLNGGIPYELTSQPAGTAAPAALQQPVAMAGDSGSAYLYVVDKGTNQIATYAVQAGGALSATTVDGVSTANTQVTAKTGNQPSSLAIWNDQFLYVANGLDSTVTGYKMQSGALSNFGTYASDDNPVAIMVDPRHVGFLYSVNFLGSSLSGWQINPANGTLVNTQHTPYPSTVQPTAISGIPHGGTTTK